MNHLEASRVMFQHAMLKYQRGKGIGSSYHGRADLPRYWNVRVGESIPRYTGRDYGW